MKGPSQQLPPREEQSNLITGRPSRSRMTEKGMLESLKSYPKGVFFMLGNEFCERFSFYGMRAVLTLYLITEHHFSDSQASLCYHAFVSLAYFSPLFGSIAADNYFGRFRVILWVSLVYVLGHVLLSVGAIPQLEYSIRTALDFSGLVTVAIATGGIKPCVSAFAADQFEEDQVNERRQFFSFFYFAINGGSLVAIMVTPLLRGRVSCFGSEYCFPLAFGVPGVLMLMAFILFLVGWKFYKKAPAAKGNVVVAVFMCICSAIKNRFTSKKKEKVEHWIDNAAPKYDEELRNGVKSLVGVAALFVPLVFYWALFDQQGSTWVLQARRMDGRVGPLTILPDQMTLFNPFLVLLMVPLFEAFVYPLMNKFFKVTPLRKMAFGGILAALAFVMAGLIQLEVNKTMEPRPEAGNVFLVSISNVSDHKTSLKGQLLDLNKKLELPAGIYEITGNKDSFNVNMSDTGKGYVLGMFETASGTSHSLITYSCEKSENGRTTMYLILPKDSSLNGGEFYVVDDWNKTVVSKTIAPGTEVKIQPGIISSPHYTLAYGKNCGGDAANCPYKKKFMAQMGAAHVLHLTEDDHLDIRTVVRPNEVNILWQVPQFIVITAGEVLFSITGLEFSYSQANPNMKSVLQAMWLMTTFFGNIIDMLISGSHVVKEPATEFFFYAFMLTFVIGIFILIARNYTYAEDRVRHDENGHVDLTKNDVGNHVKATEKNKDF
uniref:Solute carrier family 15 member 2 n=1 Tax=Steinernema glaseri TaxID=37863 RepID=A0A1I7ZFA5_9BILA